MKCKRCGRHFEKAELTETNPGGADEIICAEWCPQCNIFCANVLYREKTAYHVDTRSLRDPVKGGYDASS